MEDPQDLLATLQPFLPLLAVVAAVAGVLFVARRLLERRYGQIPRARFRSQLIMLALTLAGLLAVFLAVPMSDALRGQLLGLIGILLSATIALSSTTFLGNALAGILLRVVRPFRLGDFIRVGEHFGRASERGLFHTEIQTEDRDLTTLPNLYLVTHPVRVVRESGSIISATVSLGYDVTHQEIEKLLLRAAEHIGLQEPFVHITELGDFSVEYRVAGLLTEVKLLLSTRSRLRAAILDELHAAGIEIVSPSFMNTRALARGERILPPPPAADQDDQPSTTPATEEVVFDKAEEAGQLESLEEKLESIAEEIQRLEEAAEKATTDSERERLEHRLAEVRTGRQRLEVSLGRASDRLESGE